ncbi:MAG: SPW repeat domain-containing protein [Egibacteraceae bacterium]
MSAVRLLPWFLHEAIEYLVGIFLILAPFVFEFAGSVAFPLFIASGLYVLLLAALSRGPLSVADVLPHAAHAGGDYLLGAFLVLAPFLFGYSNQDPQLTISIFLGLAHVVITLLTAFPRSDDKTADSS